VAEPANLQPPTVHHDPVRTALDCLAEGFQIIGADWRYVYVNPAAARHGRRNASDLIGRAIVDAYPGIEETPMFGVLRRCMEQRTSEVHDAMVRAADSSGAGRHLHLLGGHRAPQATTVIRPEAPQPIPLIRSADWADTVESRPTRWGTC
jgi:PAS domain-containing protein